VTDAGHILDLASARGQVEGASVQGIAQALYERFEYDRDGNPLTTSLAEYLVPSAADVPDVESLHVDSCSPLNPLGAKGIGEIGMLAAPVAVQNAVVDALAHLGVRHIDIPCTPERVWRAVQLPN
jgi:carbon-monoxide dehydrogenase large subunit